MSAAIVEEKLDFKSLSPDIIETSTGRKIKQASAVRWIWQPFMDIPLFDNLGVAVMNSLTLRERTEKIDGKVLPFSNPVTVLQRCQPYPLTNCEYEVPRQEAMRYSHMGDALPENDLPANYSGPTPQADGTPQHIVESKFAYSSARELSEMYAKSHGLVVLEPLTGQEDSNIVRQVFEMVQPVTYRLQMLEHELTGPAVDRIRKSTYTKEVKALAEKCRVLMLKGVHTAKIFAGHHMADFSRQVQLASAGQKGQRAFAAPYDEFVAEQLGVEVPRVVQTSKVNTNDELLAKLAERELDRGGENDALTLALARIGELQQQVTQIAAAQNGKPA